MKALKYIIFLLLIIVIGLAIYIAVQPNSYEVERGRTIKAPISVVYNNVIDFKNWEAWNSWKEEDADINISLSEKTSGVGGLYSWTQDGDVGTMTTVAAAKNDSIIQEMQFSDYPKSNVKWNFIANDDGSTTVNWKISGKDLPFGFKAYVTLTGGMEKQIGPHYERSLELLDEQIQKDMKRYSIAVDGITEHSGGFYLYNTTSSKMSNFKEKMQQMFPKVGGYAISNNIRFAGAPFVLYHQWDEANNAVMFSCGVPISSKIITNEPEILTGQLKSFKAVKVTLKGDYENLKEAWEKGMAYIAENNLELIEDGPMLESYLTDPTSQPNPADWVTEIFLAVK
ncbi:effector-binding domain-containing protein [Winogradskyella wandonensis]|uniref:Effector-binding domain-containing protein n=1 Tax=Winogradskyella wandonensis TaxID=1442586 RepID=A0A4R1KU44_9FLAO|nr:GyrI-like domain-containing protein [Winogradskyella wandonensis]TCK68712.1 effector-binding domain-containing protein [Winogradskyella wandonensis]